MAVFVAAGARLEERHSRHYSVDAVDHSCGAEDAFPRRSAKHDPLGIASAVGDQLCCPQLCQLQAGILLNGDCCLFRYTAVSAQIIVFSCPEDDW